MGCTHVIARSFRSQLRPVLGILEETGNEFVFDFTAEVVAARSKGISVRNDIEQFLARSDAP